MTLFKPGDRVVYRPTQPGSMGVHGLTGTVYEQTGPLNVRVHWDDGTFYGVYPENLVSEVRTDSLTRALIGPAPKVETPTYQAPFKTDGYAVLDDTGQRVLTITSWDHHSEPLFAQYVAEALNARVFGEE